MTATRRQIISDENIPFAREAFSTLGDVHLLPSSQIDASVLRNTDILLTRSVLNVTKELVTGSTVSFVGTATIGTDHIDQHALEQLDIGFASAPGCNAQAVVEYVLTALVSHCSENSLRLADLRLGIIGVGSIGSRLNALAQSLGINTLLCDPPLQDSGVLGLVSQEEVLRSCNVISLHVPLTDGTYATKAMINDSFLSALPDSTLLINSCRGQTMVEEALLKHCHRLAPYVLDVWPEEPHITSTLYDTTLYGTPHIAGYSFDGKAMGTVMLYDAICKHFSITPHWDWKSIYANMPNLVIDGAGKSLSDILLEAYPLARDSRVLCDTIGVENASTKFAQLRKEYPLRYEFRHWTIMGITDSVTRDILTTLGFTLCT